MPPNVPENDLPEGIHSLLDTDLYKLTMQAALLQHYPNIGMISCAFCLRPEVSYIFINRKKSMRLNREAFTWLNDQINGSLLLAISLNVSVGKFTCHY
jgi:nicotinate phosphoribosyltransferase